MVLSLLVLFPTVEVIRVSDPKGTSALGLVQPFIQAIVEELTVRVRDDPAVIAGIAVEADVRMNIAIVGFVDDFSTKLHSYSPLY